MGKTYSQEYKDYVVKMIVEEGKSKRDVSHELEITYSVLCRWVNKYKILKQKPNESMNYITPSELEQLKKEHEKQLKDLQEENEILKKAMHIFTKNQE